ncbi:cysteine desulfurase family protein [Desertibacillus haloalkaliphilus]|uniref:cysteine desulfurase family protein n=1 Tax=Desertibacillus haloalkaliphilus TaxID=1328930 RepID=UPI001C273561|nr:cysteine desulfurase family protein [Desertibacillus haloalkaliphilus]MBU8905529.1 cysteine desulfurase [Desertibacillus haloalkaliphilus]
MERIYVDHAATSPVHPDVVDAMIPYLKEHFGNPSSIHHFGRENRHALDSARRVMANSIKAKDDEIIFTSGGTEADNMAITGYALANRSRGNHIITSAIEHHAVLHTCQALEKLGFEVTYLPVDSFGCISLDDLKQVVREETILITIMYGNNEVGTLQPVEEIGGFLREKGIAFHTDAVQAYGTLDINVQALPVDLLSVSSHKINGPKGIGFLYAREGIKLEPHLHGGEQERKRRAGTENIAAIVGFAKAVEIALHTMPERQETYQLLCRRMVDILNDEQIEFEINGHQHHRLPHILNISFHGVNVESFLVNLDLAGIAASSGSACTAGSLEPSHVLAAMFSQNERIASAVRFSFGLGNTVDEIEKVAVEVAKIVKRIKQ